MSSFSNTTAEKSLTSQHHYFLVSPRNTSVCAACDMLQFFWLCYMMMFFSLAFCFAFFRSCSALRGRSPQGRHLFERDALASVHCVKITSESEM